MKTLKILRNFLLCCPLVYGLISCEDYLEVDLPSEQMSMEMVFEDQQTATSAVTTLYSKLRDDTLVTGFTGGLSVLMGLYADEFNLYAMDNESFLSFYNHSVVPANPNVNSFWDNSYHLIYLCNSALIGLEESTGLSDDLKNQLTGEVLFIRSLVYFYLVNLFGDIPYITTIDPEVNQDVSRSSTTEVYQNIISDLLMSKSLLSDNYISGEKIRANKFVASAFLARVYLYMEKWPETIQESSNVINQISLYEMEPDLNSVFLKNSRSSILQLKPSTEGGNTYEAQSFLFFYGPPHFIDLSEYLINSFEAGDLRKENWINVIEEDFGVWYEPNKYKEYGHTGTSREYSVIFRIEEQFLIRAEAYLRDGQTIQALQDLNRIRNRAGLANIESYTYEEIMQAILQERKVELFSEQGHRWFDLKRTGTDHEVLSGIKPFWQITDRLFPIPEKELLMNPNLLPQNPGY